MIDLQGFISKLARQLSRVILPTRQFDALLSLYRDADAHSSLPVPRDKKKWLAVQEKRSEYK